MLDGLNSWKNAPLWTKKSIKENTKELFKYLNQIKIFLERSK